MGYTHYWKRKERFSPEGFERVVRDFKMVMKYLSPFVPLAGGAGDGEAVIDSSRICFNGVRDCGHARRNMGITWPGDGAKGIALVVEHYEEMPAETLVTLLCGQEEDLALNDSDVAGTWYAGLELAKRTCGGDCSHETFSLPLEMDKTGWREPVGKIAYYDDCGNPVFNKKEEVGLFFGFCKTAYKPYDLAVICCLIIAKHHLKSEIVVSSDGTLEQWKDGMLICQKILGYGMEFKL
jgi:hypothetical protein